jgi:hypothetical protein
VTEVDLSEMSEWDGTQAPPGLSLREDVFSSRPTRAFKRPDQCDTGSCANCGRTILSAVPFQFGALRYLPLAERAAGEPARVYVGDVRLCGRCYYGGDVA